MAVLERVFFNFLQGEWQLNKCCKLFTASGTASFSQVTPNQLLYTEQVQVQTGAHPEHQATKSYLYQLSENNLSKYFIEENNHPLFYHLALHRSNNLLSANGKHQCIDDVYEATYNQITDNSFELIYEIRGPKKDYRITNKFSRK